MRELSDGTVIEGESAIDRPRGRSVLPIDRVFLTSGRRHSARAEGARARRQMLIGPGDLYTSVIPCLLVDGIAEAIRSCDGEIVYICNVMTKHGETDGFAASDFVREIHKYLGRRVDTVVVNTGTFHQPCWSATPNEKAFPVEPDLDVVRTLVPRLLAAGRDHRTPHPPRRRTGDPHHLARPGGVSTGVQR